MSNPEYIRRNIFVGNRTMVNPLFGWFTYNEFPAHTARPPLKDTEYTLSENEISLYRIILNMVLPGLILKRKYTTASHAKKKIIYMNYEPKQTCTNY